jgi:hypothetical protein
LNGRELRIARLAAKQLERLPKASFDQITARLQDLLANQPNLDIKPLRGHAPGTALIERSAREWQLFVSRAEQDSRTLSAGAPAVRWLPPSSKLGWAF